MTALDPIFDTLPEVTVSGVSEPNVISLSLVEAIDTVNGVLVIEEIHAVDEDTEVGLGEYGTFRVRRYDYGLEPRATTLEIHRGQSPAWSPPGSSTTSPRRGPRCGARRARTSGAVWTRSCTLTRSAPPWRRSESGERLRDQILLDLSETLQRGSEDVGGVIDALLPYQIGIQPLDQAGGRVAVQLVDLYNPPVDTAREVMPGIDPGLELPHDNRNWLAAGIACKYRTGDGDAVADYISPSGATPMMTLQRVVASEQTAQLEVALQRIRGHNNRRSIRFTTPIHGPRYQLYETIRLPELKEEIPSSPDVWLVEELEWSWPRGARRHRPGAGHTEARSRGTTLTCRSCDEP